MEDEYEKLLGFFSLGTDEKSEKLEEVFEDAAHFLERFKYVFETGSVEEKRAFMGKVSTLQSKIREETKRLCEESGLNEEQIIQFAMNPQNFQKDQWEMISRNKEKLEGQAKEIQEDFQRKREASEAPKAPKKKKGGGKKGGWISG